MANQIESFKPSEITLLIDQASVGDNEAMNRLMPIIYPDLKLIASGIRHKQMIVSNTLNTTSLVNEAWLKLQKYGIKASSRKHFFCIIAKAMRQILVNTAKEKLCLKRNAKQLTLDVSELANSSEADFMIKLNEIVDSIEGSHPRLAQVFQFKYFLGFTEHEISEVLGVNNRTIRRDWLTVKRVIQEII